ncbi:hypothetical protein BCR42DRAFT_424003 [Absidia repens]|uniref:Uncharacterized protein n=1 Tax=Absidia repens TaxID=90262 RepID=A0A1X2I4I9_9FUNG|nr:hypothetical protein BCR42DRAFT_424003 [Absidia repens]
MASGTINTESTITTLTTSEPGVSMTGLTRTTTLLPSPPGLKTESASWHSQQPNSATPHASSATSAPAMFFNNFFENGQYHADDCVILDDLEEFVHYSGSNDPTNSMTTNENAIDDPSPLLEEDLMLISSRPSMPDTPMLFYMDDNSDNNGDTGAEYDSYFFDTDDFILLDHSYEPVSPPISPFVLFPPL